MSDSSSAATLPLVGLLLVSCGGAERAPQDEPVMVDPAELSASLTEVEAIAVDAADQMQCPREDLDLEELTLVSWSVTGCGKSMRYDNECEVDSDHCAWFPSELRAPETQCSEPGAAATEEEETLARGDAAEVEIDPTAACLMEVPAVQERQEAPVAPPQTPVMDDQRDPPREGQVWISGYYFYTGSQFVWVTGFWAPPNPGYAYVPGSWASSADAETWVYTPGGWALTGTQVVTRPPPTRTVTMVWVRPMPRVWLVRSGVRVVVRPRAMVVRTRRALVRRPVYRHRRSARATGRTMSRRRNRGRGYGRRR